MAQLQTMLQQCNPYVQLFKQAKEVVTTQDVNLPFIAKTGESTAAVPSLFVVHDALYIDMLLYITHHTLKECHWYPLSSCREWSYIWYAQTGSILATKP